MTRLPVPPSGEVQLPSPVGGATVEASMVRAWGASALVVACVHAHEKAPLIDPSTRPLATGGSPAPGRASITPCEWSTARWRMRNDAIWLRVTREPGPSLPSEIGRAHV